MFSLALKEFDLAINLQRFFLDGRSLSSLDDAWNRRRFFCRSALGQLDAMVSFAREWAQSQTKRRLERTLFLLMQTACMRQEGIPFIWSNNYAPLHIHWEKVRLCHCSLSIEHGHQSLWSTYIWCLSWSWISNLQSFRQDHPDCWDITAKGGIIGLLIGLSLIAGAVWKAGLEFPMLCNIGKQEQESSVNGLHKSCSETEY